MRLEEEVQVKDFWVTPTEVLEDEYILNWTASTATFSKNFINNNVSPSYYLIFANIESQVDKDGIFLEDFNLLNIGKMFNFTNFVFELNTEYVSIDTSETITILPNTDYIFGVAPVYIKEDITTIGELKVLEFNSTNSFPVGLPPVEYTTIDVYPINETLVGIGGWTFDSGVVRNPEEEIEVTLEPNSELNLTIFRKTNNTLSVIYYNTNDSLTFNTFTVVWKKNLNPFEYLELKNDNSITGDDYITSLDTPNYVFDAIVTEPSYSPHPLFDGWNSKIGQTLLIFPDNTYTIDRVYFGDDVRLADVIIHSGKNYTIAPNTIEVSPILPTWIYNLLSEKNPEYLREI